MKKIPKEAYFIIAGISIVLYLAGVFTGILTERYLSQKTLEELRKLNEEINNLRVETENLQLESLLFLASPSEKNCQILSSLMQNIEAELREFWKKLPARLEAYEKYGPITAEYEELKRNYAFVSIRAWIISKTLKERCDPNIVPVLYFYSRYNADECLKQGFALDNFRRYAKENGKIPMVFTIDMTLDEPIIKVILDSYGITRAPAVIIDSKVFQGYTNETVLFSAIS